MKMIKPAILGTLVVPVFMFASGTVTAEENTSTEATFLTETPEGSFHSDALVGNQVKSSVEDDEDIGTITDLIIDEQGQINAVVVGVSGFLGMGEKKVAIEWDSLELTKAEDGKDYVIIVSASEDALKEAENYSRDEDENEDK